MEGDKIIELSDVLSKAETKEFVEWLERQYPNMPIFPRVTPEFLHTINDRWRIPQDTPNYSILDKLLVAIGAK